MCFVICSVFRMPVPARVSPVSPSLILEGNAACASRACPMGAAFLAASFSFATFLRLECSRSAEADEEVGLAQVLRTRLAELEAHLAGDLHGRPGEARSDRPAHW